MTSFKQFITHNNSGAGSLFFGRICESLAFALEGPGSPSTSNLSSDRLRQNTRSSASRATLYASGRSGRSQMDHGRWFPRCRMKGARLWIPHGEGGAGAGERISRAAGRLFGGRPQAAAGVAGEALSEIREEQKRAIGITTCLPTRSSPFWTASKSCIPNTRSSSRSTGRRATRRNCRRVCMSPT